MGKLDGIDDAGRQIAGLLGYNPGPGIYSRLERAIEAMPENVRVQELPGLLKRYKDGVPGWELKETDLDSIIAGRDVVPREELLARVKERSPVYTHREVVLADDLPTATRTADVLRRSQGGKTVSEVITLPQYQDEASALGRGIGDPKYQDYGQGGAGYTEILLTQPGARANEYGNHWREAATNYTDAAEDAVAHARYDIHGDALRINELQSDLGIHNRKAREIPESYEPPGAFDRVARGRELPFPLEDAWSDLLIKRLALEAARKGHRAIEVASPRAIADKVGGNIDNYEHFYGKVVPGALERLGRKMGGLVEDVGVGDAPSINAASAVRSAMSDAQKGADDFLWQVRRKAPGMGDDLLPDEYNEIVRRMTLMRQAGHGEDVIDKTLLSDYHSAYRAGVRSLTGGNMQLPQARKAAGLAVNEMIARAKSQSALAATQPALATATPPAKRYLMSDEMRRRLIEGGVGASLLAPLLMQDGE
jgi:hypothetical protein